MDIPKNFNLGNINDLSTQPISNQNYNLNSPSSNNPNSDQIFTHTYQDELNETHRGQPHISQPTIEPKHTHRKYKPYTDSILHTLCGNTYENKQSKKLEFDFRNEFSRQRRDLLTNAQDLQEVQTSVVPQLLQGKYFGLRLLSTSYDDTHTSFCGYPNSVYKAFSANNDKAYALRRLDGFNLTNYDLVKESVDYWSKFDTHPCIIPLRQAFATHEFTDTPTEQGCLVYVYDYYPNTHTLQQFHTKSNINESLLWTYIIQLALALAHIHSKGVAAQIIMPSKILVSYRFRLYLNCLGLLDATYPNPHQNFNELQKQDLFNLGKLIFCLGVGSFEAWNEIPTNFRNLFSESIKSTELNNLLCLLLQERSPDLDINTIVRYITPHIIDYLESSWRFEELMEDELKKEIESDNLFRTLSKLNFIANRLELCGDTYWSETGNRYIVKLFRDYIFHQIDEHYRPIIDLGHVVDCLSKVDIGTKEKITLMSQDGSSIFILSFAEIKLCIENSFSECLLASTQSISNEK